MKASIGGGSDYPVLDEDVYLARIYSLVDIGIQDGKFGEKHQIVMTWELPTEVGEDGRPYAIGKFYTLSLHKESNLCKDIANMASPIPDDKKADFDFSKLIGMTAQLSISKFQNAENYDRNKITAVTKVMKGTKVPAAINDPIFFDLDQPDWELFKQIPEWIQNLCNKDELVDAPASTEAPIEEDDTDGIPWEE